MGLLSGKVVLVTGGGNGIGRECALLAAKEGAKVLVNDLGGGLRGGDEGSAGPAETVANEIRAAGGQASHNSESITNFAAVQAMVDQAKRELGGLHAVINPAGILRDSMFHKMDPADFDKVVEVHLRGAFNVARASIEHFRDQKDGAYVFFTSTSGLYGNIGQSNYGSAKMGVAGLSRIIALEGARSNVRANCLSPIAWTRMTQSVPVTDEAGLERQRAMAAAISPNQPARVAIAMAASTMTGQIIGCSGNTVAVFSQIRVVEQLDMGENWDSQAILDRAIPALEPRFHNVEKNPSAGLIGISVD